LLDVVRAGDRSRVSIASPLGRQPAEQLVEELHGATGGRFFGTSGGAQDLLASPDDGDASAAAQGLELTDRLVSIDGGPGEGERMLSDGIGSGHDRPLSSASRWRTSRERVGSTHRSNVARGQAAARRGGPRPARCSASGTIRAVGLAGQASRASAEGCASARPAGVVTAGWVPTVRRTKSRVLGRSDATTGMDVNASTVAEPFATAPDDPGPRSPSADTAAHGRMAIAKASTARRCRTGDRLTRRA
jgi:hypothetical protein